ncbi:lytic polysaccharide monooxygenase [Saccharothrix longispora]|uniref:lytic polysaccharide monooxygenase n=1 Tax=Saccharothrix longispora TaxID=33920 RepID=UPI0028FD7E27|nr:lytic polysaccharide monooxygenase [Saccharothrix longispora]MDU0292073.1 lytic polysaccharide monooxygenase [Saccharothrix longispora]
MRLKRFGALAVAALGVVGFTSVFVQSGTAVAHGSMTFPPSRTYACYEDGRIGGGGGDLNPTNPACVAAVQIGGKQPLWDWYGNLISLAGGKHREIIADGDLCGPTTKYDAYNLTRSDWPTTTLRAGAPITFKYNAWAPHPGTWDQYVTKDGFDVTQPLKWSDLEPVPFDSITNPPLGSGEYSWNGTLPNKSGRHVIYSIWQRSDSPEAFYSCSDVIFSGGSGGDTQAPSAPGTPTASASSTSVQLSWSAAADNVGVSSYQVFREAGANDVQVATSTGTSASVTGLTANTAYQFYVVARDAAGNTSPPSAVVSVTTTGGGGQEPGACSVTYSVPSSWSGGFTANVSVKNTGTSAVNGWQLAWDVPAGQGISQAWSADVTVASGKATARGASWNQNIQPGQTVSFGFNGTSQGTPANPVSFTLGGATCATA